MTVHPIGPVRYIRISLCYFCFRSQSTCCLVVSLLSSVHDRVQAVYTIVYTVYTARARTRPYNGRIHGPYISAYTVVYTCTRQYTTVYTGRAHTMPCRPTWPAHGRVYTARTRPLYTVVYTAPTRPIRPCTRPLHESKH